MMNREWRNTKWVLLVLGIGFLIVITGLWAWRQAAKAHYARVKAELIAQGAKLTIAEQLPVVDPKLSNGAELFLAHVIGIPRVPRFLRYTSMELIAPGKALVTSAVDDLPYETEGGRWTNNLWAVLPAYVESGRGSWVLLKSVVTNEVIAFDLTRRKGAVETGDGQLRHYTGLFRWLRLAVALDLHDENRSDAIDEVVTGVDLISRWEEDRFLAQHVRVALIQMFVEQIWEVLNYPVWRDADLARLQSSLAELDFINAWCAMLKAEDAITLQGFETALGEGRGDFPVGKSRVSAITKVIDSLKGTLGGGNLNDVLDACDELAWSFAPAYGDAAHYLRENRRWSQALVTARESRRLDAGLLSFDTGSDWFRFTYAASVVQRKFRERPFLAETIRGLALAAVALERYHLGSRCYPESLDALVPDILDEVPVDWFDGKPLRYRLEAEGSYWLWSIGSDGVDDGCKPADAGEDWLRGADLVWPQAARELEVEVYLGKQRAKMLKATGSGP